MLERQHCRVDGHASTMSKPGRTSHGSSSGRRQHLAKGTGSDARAQVQVDGPSNVRLILTNLSLLDLDRRADWPGITLTTLGAQDAAHRQKERVREVEWILYRLFEGWDGVCGTQVTRDVGHVPTGPTIAPADIGRRSCGPSSRHSSHSSRSICVPRSSDA